MSQDPLEVASGGELKVITLRLVTGLLFNLHICLHHRFQHLQSMLSLICTILTVYMDYAIG